MNQQIRLTHPQMSGQAIDNWPSVARVYHMRKPKTFTAREIWEFAAHNGAAQPFWKVIQASTPLDQQMLEWLEGSKAYIEQITSPVTSQMWLDADGKQKCFDTSVSILYVDQPKDGAASPAAPKLTAEFSAQVQNQNDGVRLNFRDTKN